MVARIHPSFALLAVVSSGFLASCSGGSAPAAPPASPVSSAPGEAEAPSPDPVTPAPTTEESAQEAPAEGEAPPPAAGRLAFVQCEEPRKPMCTREYRPVCAEVDTGVRCVKEPCPSSERKTYSNACTACADEKVTGYFAAACDTLGTSEAP